MADAVPGFRAVLNGTPFGQVSRAVISTVTGARLSGDAPIADLLADQFTAPVRFLDAVSAAESEGGIFVEAGMGNMLSGLMKDSVARPVLHTAAASASLKPLLHSLAALFVCGRAARLATLLQDRFTRPFSLDRRPRFFCEPLRIGLERPA